MKIKKKSGYGILKVLVTCISIFACTFDNAVNGYEYLFLMPITYFFCILFNKISDKKIKNNIAYISIDFLSFLKYSIMPLLIAVIDDYYSGVLTSHIPEAKYIIPAIILCCVECLSIFIVVNLFYRNRKKCEECNSMKKVKINFAMFAFLLIGLACAIIYSEGFFPTQFLIVDDTYQNAIINSSVDGLIKIIFFIFKVFILLYLTQFFVDRYRNKKGYINILGIFLVLVVYLVINTSTSRWGLVLPVLVYLYLLRDIWFGSKKNKIIIYIICLILSVSFFSISLYKFKWLFNDNNSKNSVISVVSVLSSQLQEYLSGPRAIAQGIEAVKIYDHYITYKTCINDFTGSIPYFSKYVNQNDRINIYYNYLLKGTKRNATQIMPMITIGYAYFGYLFCNLFIVICIYLCLYYGEKEMKANNIFYKYMFTLICIRFALCIGFNTQIIFAWYISNFIPFFIILKLNNLIIFKKR